MNRLQAVAFAKKYGVPVLRWVNPVRNCADEEYSVDIIESLLPGAVQYFVLGAPANIIQNHNPVSTGIVNGSRVLLHSLVWRDGYTWKPPVGARPGQVHDVPRPAYIVVVLDVDVDEQQAVDEQEEGPRHKCCVNDFIPLQLEPAEDVIQQVRLKYKKFPVDLGFATTFHKVQGQTLRRVIMFLHERRSKQLAKLIWESLYVAMTRVKSGNDMRVCYRGSDAQHPTTHGLQHLKKLKRPELYDAWLAAYDENGNWDDTKLKEEAERARNDLRKRLARVTCLGRTSNAKLKRWCSVLDLEVKYKSGTTYKNKEQYLEAIRPIWLACRNGNLNQDGQFKKREIGGKSRGKREKRGKNTTSRRRQTMYKTSVPGPRKRPIADSAGGKISKNTASNRFAAVDDEKHYSLMRTAHESSLHDVVTKARCYIKTQKQTLCTRDMQRRVYAHVEGKNITYFQFYTLAVKTNFIDDAVLALMLRHLCPDAYMPSFLCNVQNVFSGYFDKDATRDQQAMQDRRARASAWVRRIESGKVLMLPYNYPTNVHWVALFVWKDDGGEYHVQSRNSYQRLAHTDIKILRHAQNLISKLYAFCNEGVSIMWNNKTSIVPRPRVVEQQCNECAFHVVANGVLAQQGKCFSHKFNNDYVDYIRNVHVQLVSRHHDMMRRNVIHAIDATECT